jgi:hypothetical protein
MVQIKKEDGVGEKGTKSEKERRKRGKGSKESVADKETD